jgi:hypothetical protein
MNSLSRTKLVSNIAKSKRRFIWMALGFFVIHVGMTVFSTYYFASKQDTVAFEKKRDRVREPTRWHNYLDLNRWDSAHYERIAEEGYVQNYYAKAENPKLIIWYPGYPLIARGVQALTNWQMTAVFSLLSFLFTMTFWLLLWSAPLRDLLGTKSLVIGSIFILCWPGSYYWFAGMTEPLIGLALIGMIILFHKDKWNGLAGLLALATSVKQVFLALALACSIVDLIKHKNDKLAVLGRFLLSCAGFIAFEIYGWLQFGELFASAKMGTVWFDKDVSFFSIVNLSNYASNFWRYENQVAFFSMLFLLIVSMESGTSWIKSICDRSVDASFFLWWLALAYTTFVIVGNGAGQNSFASLLRFQTVNIPIILLIAWKLRTIPTWRLIALSTPIVYIMLYWNNEFIVRYWNWRWVS